MQIVHINSRLAREMGMTLAGDVTGRQLLLQHLHESLEMVCSMPQGQACPDLLWQPRKAENCKSTGRCKQLWELLKMGL